MPVSGTSFEGRLDDAAGDSADWYLLTLPAGKGLEVSMTVTAGIRSVLLYLLDENGAPFHRAPDGTLVAGYRIENWGGGGVLRFDLVQHPGRFHVGVVRDFFSNEGTYGFRFVPVDLADLALDALTVTPMQVDTDAGPLPLSLARAVTVVVRNHGAAAATAKVEAWTTSPNDPTTPRRYLGSVSVPLAPGESRTVTLTWSTLGQVGEADVHARASTRWESSLDDNRLSVRSSVLAGSTGMGVDLLNNHADAFVASAGTSFGSGAGAAAALPFLGIVTVGQYDP